MAVMPGAQYRPVPNKTTNGMKAYYGVALHIMQGTLWGSDAWFRNPKAQASAHFGVGKDGTILQWVDTKDRAWAQAAGNPYWISIEHEGKSGDSLTPEQVAADAKILAWVHKTHGVPLQSTNSVTGRGLGWHGMGGADWGGHTACPGTPIKNQRGAIITAAAAISDPKPATPTASKYEPFPGAGFFHGGRHSPVITAMGRRLVALGFGKHYHSGPGPDWTNADRANVRDFQLSRADLRGDADGIPGPKTWAALRVPKV